MPEVIPPALLNGIGVVGLVVLFWWLLATGRLVTRREVEKTEEQHLRERADLAADRDIWRDNFLDQKGLMSQVLIGIETGNKLLRALPYVEDDEK